MKISFALVLSAALAVPVVVTAEELIPKFQTQVASIIMPKPPEKMSLIKKATYYGGCGQQCGFTTCSSNTRPAFNDQGVCTGCVGESSSGERC